jgi:hypothetical protein
MECEVVEFEVVDFWGGAGRRGAARGGASLYMQGAAHHYICKGRRIIIYAGN